MGEGEQAADSRDYRWNVIEVALLWFYDVFSQDKWKLFMGHDARIM